MSVSLTHSLTQPQLVIRRETPDQPGALRLLHASDAYAASLYPAESNHMIDVAALSQQNVTFLVARMVDESGDGPIVGCGALTLHAENAGPVYGEVKRMFVDETARGLGVGRRILQALEDEARMAGVGLIRLETGVANHEAIGLYERAGYARIGPFGDYWNDPLSRFYEKRLA